MNLLKTLEDFFIFPELSTSSRSLKRKLYRLGIVAQKLLDLKTSLRLLLLVKRENVAREEPLERERKEGEVFQETMGRFRLQQHLDSYRLPASHGETGNLTPPHAQHDRSSAPQIRPTQGTKPLSDGPPATVKLTQPSDILIRVCRSMMAATAGSCWLLLAPSRPLATTVWSQRSATTLPLA
ncbi:hypothetical protein RRG08_004279 [Elysia crispata]|uniref:Uncharacterized protein n=1 Tax=Elysia crispata TaxID=231223 RepID=A0AAE1A675_9GAST|nr:hypothetical protein RRG08_004279 [Elysia crispata]